MTTPITPRGPGTQGTESELSHRSSGTSLSPSLTPTILSNRSMPRPPTSPGRPWPSQGLERVSTPLPTMSTTLSPLFGETTYPSLPREGTKSRLSRMDSGPASPTPVTAPTSLIGTESDNEEATPTMFRSWNPFLASIIAHQQTPSTGRGLTTSGMHSNRSTEISSVQNESKHGSFDERTSKPEQTGNTEERARIWNTSSPSTEEPHSTSENPLTGNSWPESIPTATRSYSAPILATDAQTYGHKQRRSSDSNTLPSGWTNDSTERRISEEVFAYDWDSIYPGFQPGNAYWDDPRPMNDSPPNP